MLGLKPLETKKCVRCNSQYLNIEIKKDEIVVGSPPYSTTLVVHVPVSSCLMCGEQVTDEMTEQFRDNVAKNYLAYIDNKTIQKFNSIMSDYKLFGKGQRLGQWYINKYLEPGYSWPELFYCTNQRECEKTIWETLMQTRETE